ncbi:MAG: M24 family metallopeptidase, partial [Ilumatobacter sp.]
CDPVGADALARHDIRLHDGQSTANRARMIKTPEELALIRTAVAGCEAGVAQMRADMSPGMTEQELWARLHAANIAAGGEWLETRLLTSGQRTNPWYQECSDKVIEAGDLVAFDTDLVGIGGYSVDISRTWTADGVAPTADQQRLFDAATEQLERNLELFRPGASFAEISQRSHLPPDDIHSVTNAAVAHGIGLCNEYPLILNRDHFDDGGVRRPDRGRHGVVRGGARRSARRDGVGETRGADPRHRSRDRATLDVHARSGVIRRPVPLP